MRKLNADFACAQNILKRVEERSEREGTALGAHKELELVSCAFLFPHFPVSGLPPLGPPSCPAPSCACAPLEDANSF